MMQAAPVRKRRRSSDAEGQGRETEPVDKKARPTLGPSTAGSHSMWQPQDIFSSPSRSYHSQQNKYDSDDQSSMLSEPGSPQVISADEEDVDMMSEDSDSANFAEQSPGPFNPSTMSSPWKSRSQAANRIPTPMIPRPKTSPIQTHIRRRHPQETLGGSSGERLDVPSPIDEDEVPTPPSAAEAAGSQLELLTVSDVEMRERDDGAEPLPQISLSPSTTSQVPRPLASTPGSMIMRKQRQRSGALSAGGFGSPMMDSMDSGESTAGVNKRGISMGYRADCEKCRLKVPGHMNHFF